MAKVHGKDSYFALAAQPIGDFCDSIELERSTDMADSTTIGLKDKTFVSGLTGGSVSLGGKWDSVATTGPDVVLSTNVGSDATTTLEYGPEGITTGKVKYSAACFVEKYQVSSPLEGVVKFSATLRISGAVTRGTFA